MAINRQEINEKYALYNGDCNEVMQDMKENSVDMTIYSPPFASMYTYSSNGPIVTGKQIGRAHV